MTISELIERLEKASGSDRELDACIAFATGEFDFKLKYGFEDCRIERGARREDDFVEVHVVDKGRLIYGERYPNYTASIDAAVQLCERVLGRLDLLEMTFQVGGKYQHCQIETERGDFEGVNMPTLPIAICLATMRALQPKESEWDER